MTRLDLLGLLGLTRVTSADEEEIIQMTAAAQRPNRSIKATGCGAPTTFDYLVEIVV